MKSPYAYFFAVMLCPLAALFAGESAAAKKPNIIFIYADDLGWGDLAAHGHPVIKTPVLDQMIKEGTDYTQFNVASAVCSPSRAAVMTGKFPSFFSIHQHFAVSSQNRKLGMPDWLDPHTTLLPRLLHEAGYATAHFGKWHLSNSYYQSPSPLQYGYDRAAVWSGEKPDVFTDVPMTNDPLGKIEKKGPEFLTVASVNHSEKFIRDFAGKKPFFLNLWIHETHQDVVATEEQKKPYASIAEPQRTYYSCVTRADTQIGRIFALLKELNIDEKTIVVFSSDNGPEIQSAPAGHAANSVGSTGELKGRKRSLMMGGVCVPFIVRWPGQLPAGRVDQTSVIGAVDILPTFCALAQAKLPSSYQSDGESVLSAWQGNDFKRTKDLFWDWRGFHGKTQYGDYWWAAGSIRRGEWGLFVSEKGDRVELYNLIQDRNQDKNLANENPQLVTELKQALYAWQITIPEKPDPACFTLKNYEIGKRDVSEKP